MSKIDVIYFEVGKEPVLHEVENTLEAMQGLVGGHIECITLEDYIIVCNENGLWQGLTINKIYDELNIALRGNFFLVSANDEGEFTSITNAENIIPDLHFKFV